MFKTFKDWLESKSINKEAFETKTVAEQASLQKEYMAYVSEALKEVGATKAEITAAKSELSALITANKDLAETHKAELADLQEQLNVIKEMGGNAITPKTIKAQVSEFIKENHEKIKQIKSSGTGLVEYEVKAVANMTTTSASNPDGIPELVGTQIAPASNINLRGTFVDGLVTNVDTSLAAYPYTETLPKDGDFTFLAEGATKPQMDFKIETRYASPVKTAAWIKLTDESVQDIRGLESIANDLLRKKHDLKRQSGILFGDGIAPNPKGATTYGRTFVAGDMALAVTNPNIMDVINACVTDVYNTHNYQDEESYMPSLAVLNPVDFFVQFVSAKNADGNPLYPTASLFNRVNIGGLTIIPERSIPADKIFVADMSKYNTTNYVGYTVKIGYVNDDFIKNQFVILGESRFHAFVKKLDEQAFIYDDISTIKTAITAV